MKNPAIRASWLIGLMGLAACGTSVEDGSTSGGGGNLVFVTTALVEGYSGASYSAQLMVAGGVGSHAWQVSAGALPPGLDLDVAATGSTTVLSGTPTATGAFQFTVTVSAGGLTVARPFELEIGAGGTLVSGWTQFVEQPGARIVHVSSAGNDSADGSLASPRRTLAGGFALLRHGQPDWLLMRRGDTFPLTGNFTWNKSGPSTGPGWMRLGAYGDEALPRPELRCSGGGLVLSPGFQSNQIIRRVAVTDVFLNAADRLANAATTTENFNAFQLVAVQWQGTSGLPLRHLLFENCRMSGFTFGLACADDVEDLTIRRCIIDHIFFARGTHSSGVLSQAQGLLLEDNVMYQIMSPDIPGLGSNAYSTYAHGAYLGASGRNVVSRGNICIKCPDSVMQRPGGTYEQNVGVHTHTAGNMGQTWGVTPTPGGVQMEVADCLMLNVLEGAFVVGNTQSGVVRSNLFLQDQNGSADVDMWLVAQNHTGTGLNIGVHNTNFVGNLVSGTINWNPADIGSYSNLTFSGNQENIGPTSTSIAAYLQFIGWSGTTVDDWAGHLMLRDRNNYSDLHMAKSIINFYRAHYALPLLP